MAVLLQVVGDLQLNKTSGKRVPVIITVQHTAVLLLPELADSCRTSKCFSLMHLCSAMPAQWV